MEQDEGYLLRVVRTAADGGFIVYLGDIELPSYRRADGALIVDVSQLPELKAGATVTIMGILTE